MDGVAREAVHRFKYGGQIYLQKMLAGWLLRCLGDVRLRDPPPEVLVPVPLHWWKKCTRGFNQAELLVSALVRLLPKDACRGDPADKGGEFPEGLANLHLGMDPALKRVRHTGTQTRFGQRERQKNVHNAFELRRGAAVRIKGRHILLVDDVFTTGATLDACTRVLRKGGAASVRALAVARG
jgi:predicted amidophosphoribosyltransferase